MFIKPNEDYPVIILSELPNGLLNGVKFGQNKDDLKYINELQLQYQSMGKLFKMVKYYLIIRRNNEQDSIDYNNNYNMLVSYRCDFVGYINE